MKFIRENVQLIVRLFVIQIGMTFFGLVLTMAVGTLDKPILKLIVSLFSILFYLYLVYGVMWEAGASHAVRLGPGKVGKNALFPLLVSVIASLPNILLGALMCFFVFLGIGVPLIFAQFGVAVSMEWAKSVYIVLHIVTGLLEAVYVGLFNYLSDPLSGAAQDFLVSGLYLFSSLPMILVSLGAYALGRRNVVSLGVNTRPKRK